MILELAPRVAQVSQNWFSLAPLQADFEQQFGQKTIDLHRKHLSHILIRGSMVTSKFKDRVWVGHSTSSCRTGIITYTGDWSANSRLSLAGSSNRLEYRHTTGTGFRERKPSSILTEVKILPLAVDWLTGLVWEVTGSCLDGNRLDHWSSMRGHRSVTK